MQSIQSAREALSISDTLPNTKALTITIVSAFFIVALLGLGLSIAQKSFATQASVASGTSLVVVTGFEPVAYQPGRYVSSEITRGYIK